MAACSGLAPVESPAGSRRVSRSAVSSAIAASSIMPGPISTVSQREARSASALPNSGAMPPSADPGQQGAARHRHAAGDNQNPAAGFLVAVAIRLGQGHAAQQLGGDGNFFDAIHGRVSYRAATAASGSAVTGAPASSSGATTL
ncbi:hypothetical protein [Azospirillum humicireducens]|uniref:hypothetical protein n=1 Tax=Azospirillum humicireducens TaxID=1226968 RepID=UPI0007C102EB|nr:hypothetical protein [Azospirillum humicireducens]